MQTYAAPLVEEEEEDFHGARAHIVAVSENGFMLRRLIW